VRPSVKVGLILLLLIFNRNIFLQLANFARKEHSQFQEWQSKDSGQKAGGRVSKTFERY